jgi:hypothetical protein
MKIKINNSTDITNKYIRWAKWKIYKTKSKFNRLIYVNVFLTMEGRTPVEYQSVICLGIPGQDIILKHKSDRVEDLWKNSIEDVSRYLRKDKERSLNF